MVNGNGNQNQCIYVYKQFVRRIKNLDRERLALGVQICSAYTYFTFLCLDGWNIFARRRLAGRLI